MKNLPLYILLILLSANTSYFSQKTTIKDNFTEIVGSEEGELNGDNRADKIIAATTNSNGIRPFRLQIFMSQPNSKNLKLIVSTTKLFESQYLQLFSGLLKCISPILQISSRNNIHYLNFSSKPKYLQEFFLNKFSGISVFQFLRKSKV